MLTRLTNPFEALTGLQDTLDSLAGDEWFGSGTSGRGVFPAVNVFQQGEDYVLVAEVPGLKRSDFEVQVQRNRVRIAGARPPLYGEGISVHRKERRDGRFDRTVSLPVEVDESGVKAEYRDGMLAVFLPRAARERATVVQID